ncbi:MAG TPA: alpha/beta hydrolase [Streptosporangiaceae bacterium]|nr:alpha/beta hydrolase [Streptosporangiaceae bacterium]
MPDRRVAMAIDHWAARFTANGVDPADFARVTSEIAGWDAWCGAWCAAAAEHEHLGRQALDEERPRSAGGHLAQAAVYYHFAKFLFVQDPVQMRAAHGHAVRCLNEALPHLDPPGERVEIPFAGTTLAAVLRRPAGPGQDRGPHPAVVLIPGLDSAKEEFRAAEQPFLDRGLATLSVDGPGQGEAEYDLAIRPDWEEPGAAILDAVTALPGVDAGRIGVWGVSLGGYYAPRLASGDSRVRACIALSGAFSFGQGWDEMPELTREAFRVRSGSDDASQARQRAKDLTLAGRAGRITAPLLVVAGRRDRIIPWRQAARLADEAAGPSELLLLDQGGHGCANVSYRHRPYAADWMARQLRG